MAPAIALSPTIANVLSALESSEGVLLARMSGSGATCFALFGSESEAQAAAQTLAQAHPQWWVKAAQMLDEPLPM
jgi:4-diphosphocytidyl-2-C-methyl-D-erythritol kinase